MSSEKTSDADASGAAPAAPAAPLDPTGTAATGKAPKAAPQAPAAPPQAPPPAVAPVKGDPVAIAAADEALKDAQDKLSEMDKWIEGAQAERIRRQQRVEIAQNLLDSLQTVQTNSDAIRAYLDQQKNILKARGEQKARVAAFEKDNGFKLAELLPKRAPIDTAMARRNTRGMSRPGGVK